MRTLPRTVGDLYTRPDSGFCAIFQQLSHLTWLLVLVYVSIHFLYCTKKILFIISVSIFRSSPWMWNTDVLYFILYQGKEGVPHFKVYLLPPSHSGFFHRPETNSWGILVHIYIYTHKYKYEYIKHTHAYVSVQNWNIPLKKKRN